MTRTNRRWDQLRAVGVCGLGACLLAGVYFAGEEYFQGFRLELGSLTVPDRILMAFTAFYGAVGLAGVLTLGWGMSGLKAIGSAFRKLTKSVGKLSDRAVLITAAALAFLIPFAVRVLVMSEAPLTDDEGSYLFSAQLLAKGQLYAEVPPDKIFFERQFMFMDGRWFSQYFLGWPALLAPFTLVGLESFANPLFSALTVPALYALALRFTDQKGARLALLLYVLSPQLIVASATLMSHTSCWMALTYFLLWSLRAGEGKLSVGGYAMLGVAFCVAFFIRPLTAAGMGLVPLGVALWPLIKAPKSSLAKAAAFTVPSVVFAALFLISNDILTGSPFKTAYQAVYDYKESQGFRFSFYPVHMMKSGGVTDSAGLFRGFGMSAAAIIRLNLDLFGWPASLLLALGSLGFRKGRVLWAIIAVSFAIYWFSPSVGIDAFGPVHYLEVSIALIVLSAVGAQRIGDAWSKLAPKEIASRPVVGATILAATITTIGLYLPTRWGSMKATTDRVHEVFSLPERAGVGPSVIFANELLIGKCNVFPRSVVLVRPTNHPDLNDEILWANWITLDQNRAFMKKHPHRKGFALYYDQGCRPMLAPLEAIPSRPPAKKKGDVKEGAPGASGTVQPGAGQTNTGAAPGGGFYFE